MPARAEIPIDLEQYGLSGTLIMGLPSLRKKAMLKNALGNCAVIEIVNGERVVKETRLGDSEVVELLAFVARAPATFGQTLESFYNMCDRMDEKDFGSAERLFEAMTAAKIKLQEGECSPFADSQEAGTERSA